MATQTPSVVARINTATQGLRERREFSVLFGLAAIWGIGLFLAPGEFLELSRFNRMFRSAAQTAVIGYGVALLMITAEFDLSVGSLFALTGGMAVFVISRLGIGSPFALALILVFAFLYGISQGLMVTKLNLPSLIVTIGTLTLLRGALRVLTGGVTISAADKLTGWFAWFGKEQALGELPFIGAEGPYRVVTLIQAEGIKYQLPYLHSEVHTWSTFSLQIIWMLVFLGVFHYLLFNTRFGYHARAAGDNVSSVDTTGIDPDLIKIGCFGIASLMSAFAVSMKLGRSMGVSSTTGSGLELTAIAAVVLGGTKLTGGRGTMIGTALGALVFASANTVLNLAGLGISGWRGVVTGAFIIAAIGIDAVFRIISLDALRSSYVVPTRELLTSPSDFFGVKLRRKTTDNMFAYTLLSILLTGIVILIVDAILTFGSVESALGIDTSNLMIFLQGGFISAFIQVYFFVFLIATLAFLAVQGALRGLGASGGYKEVIGIITYSMLPAPLLTIPVMLYGYDFRIPALGGPLMTGLLGLAPVLLLILALMYVGISRALDLPARESLLSVGAVAAVWIVVLGYVLLTVLGIS